MSKITIFYHVYIPEDHRAEFWNWWLDEQLGVIEKSGLSKVANVRLYITMPVYLQRLGQYVFESFKNIVDEYIKKRYGFVSYIQYRDVGEENLYEGATLIPMWEYSINFPGEIVVYIHTKGVLSIGVQTKCWRELLNEIIINQWRMRLYDIKDHDVVGVTDFNPAIMSGNFFWSKTDYISTLPMPYYAENRYKYENWIMLNNPNRKIVFNIEGFNLYTDTVIYDQLLTGF